MNIPDPNGVENKPACKKAAAKPKSAPRTKAPEKHDPPNMPKQELQRSHSSGVASVLQRGNTSDSDLQPKNLQEMTTAAEALEEEMKEKEKSLAKLEKEGKRRERDPVAHARRMRFYRSLSSLGLWISKGNVRVYLSMFSSFTHISILWSTDLVRPQFTGWSPRDGKECQGWSLDFAKLCWSCW